MASPGNRDLDAAAAVDCLGWALSALGGSEAAAMAQATAEPCLTGVEPERSPSVVLIRGPFPETRRSPANSSPRPSNAVHGEAAMREKCWILGSRLMSALAFAAADYTVPEASAVFTPAAARRDRIRHSFGPQCQRTMKKKPKRSAPPAIRSPMRSALSRPFG